MDLNQKNKLHRILINVIKNTLKYNTDDYEFIGRGRYAVVLGNKDRVIKITTDINDIIISSRVMNHPDKFKHIIPVYNTFVIINTTTGDEYYVIESMRADVTDNKVLYDFIDYFSIGLQANYHLKNGYEDKMKRRIKKSLDIMSMYSSYAELSNKEKAEFESYIFTVFTKKFLKMTKECIALDMQVIDFYEKNVGWKDNEMYLFDLGHHSAKDRDIEKINKIYLEL